MKEIRVILMLIIIMVLSTFGVQAQSRWTSVTDTLQRYGGLLTLVGSDSVCKWFVEREAVVGYQQCYNEYYDMLSMAAEKARQQQDSLMYDLGMSRLFMAWQKEVITTDSACNAMLRLKELCRKRYGEKTYAYTSLNCIMAAFHCAAGNYNEADSCYNRIVNYSESGLLVYVSHYNLALHSMMVAEVGRGRFHDAGRTAEAILSRAGDKLDKYISGIISTYSLNITANLLKKAERIARQMVLPMLPPAPKTVCENDIEPWPILLPSEITNSMGRNLLDALSLHEQLFYMHDSEEPSKRIKDSYDETSKALYNYEHYGSIAPPISSELCRRSARMSERYAELSKTQVYNHDTKSTEPMTRWRQCFVGEQLNCGERSAEALLHFSCEWIKKGYPLSVLPLVEEAAATMHRDFKYQRPTMRQMLLRRHDREWLAKDFPKLLPLVESIPEYAAVIADFKALANEPADCF